LTPTGRRGKGKITLGLTYEPPTPSDATQVILLTVDIPKCSKELREKGKCKYIVVPGETVKRDEGWEVDFKSFLEEQNANAEPGSLPGPTRVFLDVTRDPTLWNDKIPSLKKSGLAGVLVDKHEDIAKAESLNLPALYKINDYDHTKGLDVTAYISTLSEKLSSNLAGCVLPGHPEGFYDQDENKPPTLLQKPPPPYDDLPIIIELGGVKAGDGELQYATRKLAGMGYSSILMLPSILPVGLPPTLPDITNFWVAALSTLGSLRSNKFGGFRSKVALEKDVPMEWLNYQKDVMSSGALGATGEKPSADINTDAGDYQGF